MQKLRNFMIVTLLLVSIPHYASAVTIVPTAGDNSVLESILGFDAGSLGIVDIDFGGNTFNKAFGTDPKPAGYLFSETRDDGLALITSIQSLLNDYNAGAATPISRINNQILGTGIDIVPYINVAYDVRPSSVGVWQINSSGSSTWADPFRGNDFSRDVSNLVYARLTSAGTVPVPATLAVLRLGIAGIGYQWRKKTKAA